MPPHSVYIESHLGGGALMKRKPTGVRSIGIDRDAQALEAFACGFGAWSRDGVIAHSPVG